MIVVNIDMKHIDIDKNILEQDKERINIVKKYFYHL